MRILTYVIVAVATVFTSLLVAVVVVGLLRDQIDTTGLALLLVPTISGLVLGSGLKRSRSGDDRPTTPQPEDHP